MNLEHYYNNLTSERLIFRKLTLEDKEAWESFFINNPNVKYLDTKTIESAPVMAERWINRQIQRYEQNEFGQLAVILKETGDLIGTGGLKYIEYKGECALNTMINIKPSYWKQGYGSEINRCFFNCVFENNFANSVINTTHANNVAIHKLLEKAGFEKIDLLKTPTRNIYIWKLSKANWLKIKKYARL